MTSAFTHAGPAAGRATWRLVAWPLTLALIALVAYHVALTASTVAAFGLRHPFQDQYRLNLRYLTLPFPESVLALENGHRPILPGLVRVVELEWLKGAQWLEAATAWGAAAVALVLILRCVLGDLRGRPLLAMTAMCATGTLLLWNANARMFIHAYEAVHVFYILAFLTVSTTLALRAAPGDTARWALAVTACIAATFTFGPGIGAFAALLAVAWVRRVGARVLAGIGAAAALMFVAYAFLLPGADGVRGASAAFSASRSVFFALARIGAVVAETMRLADVEASRAALAAAAAGALAAAAMAVSVVARWRRRNAFGTCELMGIALFTFGATVNVLLAINRSAYFLDYPGQMFADRYLFWSCVPWVGVALYASARTMRAPRPAAAGVALIVLVASAAAIAPARWCYGWASEVFRGSELSAIAAWIGVRDETELRVEPEIGAAFTTRALDAMQRRGIGMYATPATPGRDRNVDVATDLALPDLRVRVAPVAAPAARGARLDRVSGVLPAQVAAQARGARLWLADRDGMVRGRAALTGSDGPPNALFVGAPAWVVLEGYAVEQRPFGLVLLAERDGAITPVARLTEER